MWGVVGGSGKGVSISNDSALEDLAEATKKMFEDMDWDEFDEWSELLLERREEFKDEVLSGLGGANYMYSMEALDLQVYLSKNERMERLQ